MDNNFEIIELNIRKYKNFNSKLEELKGKLEELKESLSDVRKNFSKFETGDYNAKIKELNTTFNDLKKQISVLKKEVKEYYSLAESLIFEGINNHYTDVYDKMLSRLYGYNVEIYVYNIGDDFDTATCHAELMVVTKIKKQHGKILKAKSFAIKNTYNNVIQKKASVEICVYSKKHKAGEVLRYDAQYFI
jgi:DNA repair exonuclease SbcCD ATPase subunit